MQTLVLGASTKPFRTSYEAVHRLLRNGHSIVAIGKQKGELAGVPIHDNIIQLNLQDLDTITIYLSAKNQEAYEQWILDHRPKRVIFNPGAENIEFEKKLQEAGIEVLRACTLVMLATNQY